MNPPSSYKFILSILMMGLFLSVVWLVLPQPNGFNIDSWGCVSIFPYILFMHLPLLCILLSYTDDVSLNFCRLLPSANESYHWTLIDQSIKLFWYWKLGYLGLCFYVPVRPIHDSFHPIRPSYKCVCPVLLMLFFIYVNAPLLSIIPSANASVRW